MAGSDGKGISRCTNIKCFSSCDTNFFDGKVKQYLPFLSFQRQKFLQSLLCSGGSFSLDGFAVWASFL